jgi:hypothetical protein
MSIRLIYRSEGSRIERTFRTIDQARRWMYSRLGPAPTPCDSLGFVASDDAHVVPVGCTIKQLMGGKRYGT